VVAAMEAGDAGGIVNMYDAICCLGAWSQALWNELEAGVRGAVVGAYTDSSSAVESL